jgi:hypothetical protein
LKLLKKERSYEREYDKQDNKLKELNFQNKEKRVTLVQVAKNQRIEPGGGNTKSSGEHADNEKEANNSMVHLNPFIS